MHAQIKRGGGGSHHKSGSLLESYKKMSRVSHMATEERIVSKITMTFLFTDPPAILVRYIILHSYRKQ